MHPRAQVRSPSGSSPQLRPYPHRARASRSRENSGAAADLALAPDQPLLLNFLGYAKLERGEDTDGAEAMIQKASELAPEDASIIDSLGWAQFKRGKTSDAIS